MPWRDIQFPKRLPLSLSFRRRAPLIIALLLLGFLPARADRPATPSPPAPHPPRLVVLIVIDQFRQDFLTRFTPFFGTGGFRRLMEQGANFTSAHYTNSTTYTGPGHACIVTGTYPYKNGILAIYWYNRASKQREAMVYDPDAQLLDGPTEPTDETSPRNLIGTTIGDQLILSNNGHSRVLGLSNKDRAAQIPGGKLGKAYWFSERRGEMTSSTYYGRMLPRWLQEVNARRLPDASFNRPWTRLLPESAYNISRADDYPYESNVEGLGRTFPHPVNGRLAAPGPAFYAAFMLTPWANDYQFAVARAAIEAENLRRDEYPDFLSISLTAQDLVGHEFGPESQEAQDLVVRTDRQLAEFLAYLTGRFAPEDLLIAFTADHGGMPIPEYLASLGLQAGRIPKMETRAVVERALDAHFGEGD
ncbi:MAG: hypothetical protein C4321_10875 [Chloroflexota bacterium]